MLSLLLLLVNVYDTYKVLKAPDRPSERARAARKRAMKGCVCTWIVWGCWSLLERIADRLVGWVIPFYGSGKNVLLLLLIVGRARATEPIYLHLLRPVIKSQTHLLDIAFYMLDATLSILLLALLAPSLWLYEHVLRPVFSFLAPLIPSLRAADISKLVSRRASQAKDRLRSRTVEDMQDAVDAANAIYEGLEKIQESVRRRRNQPPELRENGDDLEREDVPQLRVRRKNLPPQERRPPATKQQHRPPPVPPKMPQGSTNRRPSPPPSPPPPAYTEQLPHTPEPTRFKAYPLLPVEIPTVSRTLHEAMSTPPDSTFAFPTLATVQPPSGGRAGRAATRPGDEDSPLRLSDLVSPTKPTSHAPASSAAESSKAAGQRLWESTTAVPRKRSIDGSPILQPEALRSEVPEVVIEDSEVEENTQKRRRLISEDTAQTRPNGTKPRLGPARRIFAPRAANGQTVETYRRAVSGGSIMNGKDKGKGRDYGDDVELVPDRIPRPVAKTQAKAGGKRAAEAEPAEVQETARPLRRSQSKDELPKPAAKRRAPEPIEEVPETVDRPLTRSTARKRAEATNPSSEQAEEATTATRTRAGLGRQGAISARGGRGRGRTVSGV